MTRAIDTILALVLFTGAVGVAGCDGDDRSMDLLPVCYHDLTGRYAGPISVSYRIAKSGNCDIFKVTFFDANGNSQVIVDPAIPWYEHITIVDSATHTIGFRAEGSASDGSITSTVNGTAVGGSVPIAMSETCTN